MSKPANFLLFLLTGYSLVASPQSSAPAKAPQLPDPSQYLLGPDDQIKIWVLGVEEIADKPVRIDPSGGIDLPLIGRVHAGGLTAEQLKAELVRRFSNQLLKPQVTVELVDYGSQPVSVLGAVNHPGVHQLRGRATLAELISMADGLRLDAGPRIIVSRQIQNGPIPLPNARQDPTGQFTLADVDVKELLGGKNPTENILICARDVITVPVAEAVYVVGAVRKPGEIALKSNSSISVLQALSSAEGFGETPAPQSAKIVRIVPGSTERKEIPVDLRKILAGRAEDIAMRSNDILVVPISGSKKFAEKALEAAIQAAIGAAIWRP
jgi:polysaccharide export outer membrane protein